MARDDLHWAARIVFLAAGPQSGSMSYEFHFQWIGTGTPLTASLNQLATDVAGFVVTLPAGGGGHPLGYWLSPCISRSANTAEVAVYSIDMADPHHYYGSPYTVGTFTVPTSSSASPLPSEVALVASYRADYGTDPEHGGSTRPRADDRGRVYTGPFNVDALAYTTTTSGLTLCTPSSALISTVSAALTGLANAAFAHQFKMCVWSRKRAQFKEVIQKAVNDEFDTQRRRGTDVSLLNWVAL